MVAAQCPTTQTREDTNLIRPERIVLFALDKQLFGVPLMAVVKVVRVVEITPLPGGPAFIRGVINVQGRVMPVLDLRRRFGLAERPLELSDQLLITRSAGRDLALLADSACEVREYPEPMLTAASEIFPDLPFLAGVVKLPDGLILLQDLESLLSPTETRAIDELVTGGAS